MTLSKVNTRGYIVLKGGHCKHLSGKVKITFSYIFWEDQSMVTLVNIVISLPFLVCPIAYNKVKITYHRVHDW